MHSEGMLCKRKILSQHPASARNKRESGGVSLRAAGGGEGADEGVEELVGVTQEEEDDDDEEEALELVEEDEEQQDGDNVADVPIEELERMFGIEGSIMIDEAVKGLPEPGRVGLPRVVMHHSDGSALEVFLLGANATSWVLPNGGDVLYALPSSPFDGSGPIEGGMPIAFPQVGKGGEFPGATPGAEAMPDNGFARFLDWRISATVRHLIMHSFEPL